MLMLSSYADESGHVKDPKSHFVGLGGLTGTHVGWEEFENSWQSLLEEYIGGRPFHMNEFAQVPAIGPYQGWDEDKRREFFGKLVGTICESGAIPFGTVVSLEDWEFIDSQIPGSMTDFLISPYHLCFQDVTRAASLVAMAFNPPFSKGPEKVAMVYAYQQEYGTIQSSPGTNTQQQGRAESLWHAMQEKTVFGQWMGSYASAYPKDLVPLQAADLFAYELTKEFENRRSRPQDNMRWALRQLLPRAGERMLHKFYTVETLMELLLDMGLLALDKDSAAGLSINASLRKIGDRELLQLRMKKNAGK